MSLHKNMNMNLSPGVAGGLKLLDWRTEAEDEDVI